MDTHEEAIYPESATYDPPLPHQAPLSTGFKVVLAAAASALAAGLAVFWFSRAAVERLRSEAAASADPNFRISASADARDEEF